MGRLRRLLGAMLERGPAAIQLDLNQPFWELDGKTDFPNLLRALTNLLPEDSVLYFEGGCPNQELLAFFNTHTVPQKENVAVGALWPKPLRYHVPAAAENLGKLVKLSERCVEPELAVHFHVYRHGKVLLAWHDAFAQPMLLSGEMSQDKVKSFAHALSMRMERHENNSGGRERV